MSVPKPADRAKLFLSAIYADRGRFEQCLARLQERFGACDYQSKEVPFQRTSYYQEEMGAPLFRQFLSFRDLIRPEALPEIKLFTNALEREAAEAGQRRVNLDPGYLNLHHLILATGKGAAHRPYLGQGIYADLTLIYASGTFKALAWTYPDYAEEAVIGMLNRLREVYKDNLRRLVEA